MSTGRSPVLVVLFGNMGKSSKQKQDAISALSSFKYGMPVYGVAWPQDDMFYICGGGGASNTGIKNRLVGAQRVQGALSDQRVEHDFDKNCPMRLAMHPNGKSMALAMAQGGIKRFDIDAKGKVPKLTEASGDFAERLAADKSPYRCIAFNPRGDALILGALDGTLKVLGWPSLEVKLHLTGDAKLLDGIRDVAGAPGARVSRCAVVLDNGTAEVWDWDLKVAVCKAGLAKGEPLKSDTLMNMTGPGTSSLQALPKGMQGARFACLRYAPAPTPAAVLPGAPSTPTSASAAAAGGSADVLRLFSLMNNRQGTWVVQWEEDASTGMIRMVRYKHLGEDPSVCLDVSPCGRLLAVATSESVIMVLSANDLSVARTRPKAHTVFCTGVVFSPDSQHVVSTSGDASVTLTPTAPEESKMVDTLHRIFVLFLIFVAACLLVVLWTVRYLKFKRQHLDVVDKIGDVLRWANIVKD